MLADPECVEVRRKRSASFEFVRVLHVTVEKRSTEICCQCRRECGQHVLKLCLREVPMCCLQEIAKSQFQITEYFIENDNMALISFNLINLLL